MEMRDPMSELLSSLEQIVLNRDDVLPVPEIKAEAVVPEPKHIREISGMPIDEFALAMGVSVSSVKSWEARRTRPSGSAQKLLQLLHANPLLYKQLMN